ncbi:hypothetical protein ACN4EG_27820, partial [Alkalinema pantanalense CENA528]|uniref:hypothetical protein n=1 Tax=Alkalinema pantanalense TaxID=1620705 RepID=UPI003D6E4B72
PRTAAKATLALKSALYCLRLLPMKYSYHSLSFQSLTTCPVFGVHRSLNWVVYPLVVQPNSQGSHG